MEEVVKNLMLMQNQFRICHWQTEYDAQHRAFGFIYESLDDLIDKFVEVCMGKHVRFSFDGGATSLEFFNLGDMDVDQFINSCLQLCQEMILQHITSQQITLLFHCHLIIFNQHILIYYI